MAEIHSRVTLADLAKATGLHYSSVSLALRDSPKIPVHTRDKVKAVARKMGYAPDPMLKALCVYRSLVRPKSFQSTLAWINSHPQRRDPSRTMMNEMYAAARAHAAQLGYAVEEFWTRSPSLSGSARLSRVLRSRGIQGILFAPQPAPDARFELEWNDFSSIAFGYSLKEPQLHLVINHQYRTMRRILREIRALGYQRVGLCLSEEYDRRVDHNWSAGFWVDFAAQPKTRRVTPLIYPTSTALSLDEFHKWFKQQRPDVIVSGDIKITDWLTQLGVRVPGDVGYCAMSLPSTERYFSGAYENNSMVAGAGVDFLINLIHRGERGVPKVPQRVLIDCIWLPGKTLRDVSQD